MIVQALQAFKITKNQFKKILEKNKNSKNFSGNQEVFDLMIHSGLSPVLLINRDFLSLQEENGVKKVFNIKPIELSSEKLQEICN